jgi:hypothetical protein
MWTRAVPTEVVDTMLIDAVPSGTFMITTKKKKRKLPAVATSSE